MSTKLAGQRAKFSRARAVYHTTDDEGLRDRAVRWMGEVLRDAPLNGFAEDEVTQGEDVPGRVRDWLRDQPPGGSPMRPTREEPLPPLPPAIHVDRLETHGTGGQFVYAYGYRCAPDRLKIGSATGDAYARVAAQISTGTPDRPDLVLLVRTHDCRALEKALHGALRLRGRQVEGAGAEWFRTTRAELIDLCAAICGEEPTPSGCAPPAAEAAP